MGDKTYCFSIDTLSDGSEYSGDAATLFLSLWNKSYISEDHTSSLIARYAVAGCSCDVLSRAAADQRYKLGGISAVFCTSASNFSSPQISALPGLLYTSQKAFLTVVLPAGGDRLEQLVQTIHGNQLYPKVRICEISTASGENHEWWRVYDDEHVIVHAHWCFNVSEESTAKESISGVAWRRNDLGRQGGSGNGGDTAVVVYLYTLRSLLRSAKNSIMILPEAASPGTKLSFLARRLGLPSLSTDKGIAVTASLLTTLVVQSKASSYRTNTPIYPDGSCFFLLLTRRYDRIIDPGLLVRAQQQTRAWRKHCNPSVLPYFPFNEMPHEDCSTAVDNETPLNDRRVLLRSGTSLVFEASRIRAHGTNGCGTTGEIRVTCVDRNEQRQRTKQDSAELVGAEMAGNSVVNHAELDFEDLFKDRDTWSEKLKEFLIFGSREQSVTGLSCEDENEIDLNDDESDSQEQSGVLVHVDELPHLLVLGTGCASPSPHRGASGYALILPSGPDDPSIESRKTRDKLQSSMVVAVEVGEGYCTQWNRYAGDRPFSSIQLIWISHAHWDHYGGLVNLLIQIDLDKRSRENLPESSKFSPTSDTARAYKRSRASSPLSPSNRGDRGIPVPSPPWVVAPPKVLQFLKLIFDKPKSFFRGVLPEDTEAMAGMFASFNSKGYNPFIFWENFRVDHSCQAYGFVAGFRYGKAPFVFCFSGDTRPSRTLVQACRERSTCYGAGGRVDLLLHEATFDESERRMSLEKKHSTVQEALKVARDVDARRLLLTHFSQRYDSVPDIAVESDRYGRRMLVGFALDGLMVPLLAN